MEQSSKGAYTNPDSFHGSNPGGDWKPIYNGLGIGSTALLMNHQPSVYSTGCQKHTCMSGRPPNFENHFAKGFVFQLHWKHLYILI
jgi:hypothetical protein